VPNIWSRSNLNGYGVYRFYKKAAYIFAPSCFPPLPVNCPIFSLYTVTGNGFLK